MKLGVVIATFQNPNGRIPIYLKRALDSIFAQSHQDFKVFVIGDKYEDNDEFLRIVSPYPKEKLYYENLPYAKERDKYNTPELKHALWCTGGVNAMNVGLDQATKEGLEYICFLDHDDFWLSNHFKVITEAIKEVGADWMCTKSIYMGCFPPIDSSEKYIDLLPQPEKYLKSSVCMNFKKLPIRFRDVLAEKIPLPSGINYSDDFKNSSTVDTAYPCDADVWIRAKEIIERDHLKSVLINAVTCAYGRDKTFLEEAWEKGEVKRENKDGKDMASANR